jgi:hypothetical protein
VFPHPVLQLCLQKLVMGALVFVVDSEPLALVGAAAAAAAAVGY